MGHTHLLSKGVRDGVGAGHSHISADADARKDNLIAENRSVLCIRCLQTRYVFQMDAISTDVDTKL